MRRRHRAAQQAVAAGDKRPVAGGPAGVEHQEMVGDRIERVGIQAAGSGCRAGDCPHFLVEHPVTQLLRRGHERVILGGAKLEVVDGRLGEHEPSAIARTTGR
jgi:hypothetical protein